jgi:hypothetical protein
MLVPTLVPLPRYVLNVMETVTLMMIVLVTLSASREMLMRKFLVVVLVLHLDGITATMTVLLMTT